MSTALKPRGTLATASVWHGAAIYIHSGLLLVPTPVFTRLMSTQEYGHVVLYNSWVTVLGYFATLMLHAGSFQTGLLEFEEDSDAFASSMVGLTTASVFTCFITVAGLISVTHDFTGVGWFLLIFMFVGFLFDSSLRFWQSRERFHYRYRLMAALSISSSVVGISGAVGLVILMPAHRVEGRIVAAALPSVLVGLILYVFLLRNGRCFFSGKYWRHAFSLNIFLLPHYASQALILQFDKFAIERSSGKSDVAIYGLAYAVTSAAILFGQAINASFIPWTLRQIKEGRFSTIARRATDLTAAVAFVSVLLALIAPELVAFLAPDAYRPAAAIVPVLLLASYLQFVGSVFTTVQFYRKRAVAITTCSILAAAANIVGNLWLIRLYGFAAAAYVLVVSQLLQLAFHYAYVWRRDRVSVIDGYRVRWITGVSSAFLAVAVAIQHLIFVRLSLFASLAAIFLIFSHKHLHKGP